MLSGTALQEVQRATAWGEELESSSLATFGYTGEPGEASAGLVYLRARWSGAALASFVSRDPLHGELRLPLSRQPYSYSRASPLMVVDPSGRFGVAAAVASTSLTGSIARFQAFALKVDAGVAAQLMVLSIGLEARRDAIRLLDVGIKATDDLAQNPRYSDFRGATFRKWFGRPGGFALVNRRLRAARTKLAEGVDFVPAWNASPPESFLPEFTGSRGLGVARAKRGRSEVWLRPRFLTLRRHGADSRGGVVAHEATHIAEGLPDLVYGPDAECCPRLAHSSPLQARQNPDNFKYFVEDLEWDFSR